MEGALVHELVGIFLTGIDGKHHGLLVVGHDIHAGHLVHLLDEVALLNLDIFPLTELTQEAPNAGDRLRLELFHQFHGVRF